MEASPGTYWIEANAPVMVTRPMGVSTSTAPQFTDTHACPFVNINPSNGLPPRLVRSRRMMDVSAATRTMVPVLR